MMVQVSTNVRPLNPDEIALQKRALRNKVICIGWLKFVSVIYFVILYFMVHAHSKGRISKVLQIMTLVTIIPQVLHGGLIFLGALEEKPLALEIALWLCVVDATYSMVLGVIGGIYFIRAGHLTVHFVLAVIFGTLALSWYTIICHDVIIIHEYKKMLIQPSTSNEA